MNGTDPVQRLHFWNARAERSFRFSNQWNNDRLVGAAMSAAGAITPPRYSPSRNRKSSSVSARVKLSSPRMSAARALLLRWRVAALSDMNGDGIADLVFQNNIGQIAAWYLNASGGTTSTGYLYTGALGDWRVR